jgi:hypothetical protein
LPSLRKTIFGILAAAGIVITGGASWWYLWGNSDPSDNPAGSQSAQLRFVGSQSCSGCHQAQAALWQNSQHRHAMDHATDASVRGNFNDAAFEYAGTRSRFFRKDRKFLVETDGPDGKLATFEVKYTFGLDPLQQYLIEFPDGRVQALSIAWDTRPRTRAASTGFISIPMVQSPMTIPCIGRS